jgi:hypothetical protein
MRQRVDLVSTYDRERVADDFFVVPYDIAHGSVATYFPETNVLVPLGFEGGEERDSGEQECGGSGTGAIGGGFSSRSHSRSHSPLILRWISNVSPASSGMEPNHLYASNTFPFGFLLAFFFSWVIYVTIISHVFQITGHAFGKARHDAIVFLGIIGFGRSVRRLVFLAICHRSKLQWDTSE